jgi:diguanylate cyclase (GGDEF)-like protein
VALPHQLSWDASACFVGRPTDPAIPSYTRLDTGLTWQWSKKSSLRLVGQNLLKGRHEEFVESTASAATTLMKRGGQRILDLQDKLIEAREELRFRATHDALTGLANRGVILETLNHEHSRQRREGSSFGVILMDIDHFKEVNDRHGHLTGDTVLREMASTLKESVRPYDTVGRYGGEEFLIVVPEAEAQITLGIAERIRKAVESRGIVSGEHNIHVTGSFGVAASAGPETIGPQALLRLADEALYRAKGNGRNRCEVAHDVNPTNPVPLPSGSHAA